MRVLITRPRAEAEALAAILKAHGIESTIESLLEIEPAVMPAPSLDGVAALLFTSANGVRAFATLESRRRLPVYAVGERTAETAREVGFPSVESARGDVGELASLVRRKLDPKNGALLYPAGAAVKGDLAAMLAPDGFEVRRLVLYEAVPKKALSSAAVAALLDGSLDAVLLFSNRSAETFISLVRGAGVEEACARLIAICLSPAVAEAASAITWREVRTASRPEQAALLELLAPAAGLRDAKEGTPAAILRDGEQRAPISKADSVADTSDEKPEGAAESQAMRTIRAFGGIRPMAAKLGVPVTTVQGWKERGTIPEQRVAEVLAAAAKHGVALSDADLKTAANGKPVPQDGGVAAAPETPPLQPAAFLGDAKEGAQSAPAADPAANLPDAKEGTASAPNPSPGRDKQQANESPGGLPPRPDRSRPVGSRAVAAALWATAFAGLLLAGALSLPYWVPLVGLEALSDRGNAASEQQLQALRTRLEALESRVETAKSGAAAGPGAELSAKTAELTDAVGAMQRRVKALEGSLGELANRPEPKPGADPEKLATLADQTASLGQRVADLEASTKKNSEAIGRHAALILAVGQLREALARNTPYERALAAVAHLAEDDATLDGPLARLKDHATSGVATRADLAQHFDAVSLAAARAASEPAGSGWAEEALARLSHLFVVRRVNGDVAGNDTDAVLARAGGRLDAGDLAGAVAQLAALHGTAAEAVKPWLDEANARLAADRALDEIGARAIARLDESRS
ncbi:MAG TPA: uroporphyrinogen-III synthase [Alphaproteobacteria bacterium]